MFKCRRRRVEHASCARRPSSSRARFGRRHAGAAGLEQAEFLKAPPAFFDPSGMEVFQSEATSKDGTTIPIGHRTGACAARKLIICLRRVRDQPDAGLRGHDRRRVARAGATYVVANIPAAAAVRPDGHLRRPILGAATPSTRRRIGHAIDAAHIEYIARRHRRGPIGRLSQAPGSEKEKRPPASKI